MDYLHAVILLGCCCTVADVATEPLAAKEVVEPAALRKRHAESPCRVLKIAEPVEVTEVFYYKDGGSIGLVLTDAKKVVHRCCFDGRKPGVFPLVLDATYPTQPKARAVALRGPEETDLYRVLLRWANRHPARAALFDVSAKIDDAKYPQLWEVRQFILRLDRRFTGAD